MGRTPCCDKSKVKRGPWSPEEDAILKNYLEKHGRGGNWIALPQKAGLKRCGKSCRLRWLNYLRPDIKHGSFTPEEDEIICTLYNKMGSRWSIIASQLPGRTDNDVKNHWNTKVKKKLAAGNRNPSSKMENNKNSTDTKTMTTFHSSRNMLPLVPQNEAHNPSFSAPLNSPRMPILTDDPTGISSNTKNIAYDPMCCPLPRITEGSEFSTNAKILCNFSPSQEGFSISGSSSLAMDDNYATWSSNGGVELVGLPIDVSNGYPYEVMSAIWSQEGVHEALPTTSYAHFANPFYVHVDTKPQDMSPNVTTKLC